MKNIFIENKKLIGEIARNYDCTLDVAKDRLKADLLSGGDSETGGLIPQEVRRAAQEIGPEGIRKMNAEYFEHMKEVQAIGKPFDASEYSN